MIRIGRVEKLSVGRHKAREPLSRRAKALWTLGNFLMLAGLVLLLYVGGLYARDEYGRFAARGDTDEPAPRPVSPNLATAPLREAEPAPFVPAILNAPASSTEGLVTGLVPDIAAAMKTSSVTRVVIPKLEVDSKVVSVGWEVVEQRGQKVAVWQVAEYAVGHHLGSANPGDGDNIVLAGHVGGYGKVFKDLIELEPGDQITLYSDGQQYLYTVSEKLLVMEEGVSPEQQAKNAQYIAPTDREMITLVTCWPPSGRDKFTQRVIVRAVPFGADERSPATLSPWTVR